MTTIVLKLANEADVSLIRTLAQKIWYEHYPAIIGLDQIEYMLDRWYDEAALLKQIREEGQVFRLVYLNGSPMGYISTTEQGGGVFYLNKFYIDVSNQSKGIGAAVFNLVLEAYPTLREFRLNVNRQNYKSVNFYFKMGFVIESCFDLEVGDGYYMNDFQMVYKRP